LMVKEKRLVCVDDVDLKLRLGVLLHERDQHPLLFVRVLLLSRLLVGVVLFFCVLLLLLWLVGGRFLLLGLSLRSALRSLQGRPGAEREQEDDKREEESGMKAVHLLGILRPKSSEILKDIAVQRNKNETDTHDATAHSKLLGPRGRSKSSRRPGA